MLIAWHVFLGGLVLLSGVLLAVGFLLLRQTLRQHARKRARTRG